MLLIASTILAVFVGYSVAPSPPDTTTNVVGTPSKEKFVYADNPTVVNDVIRDGYLPQYLETPVLAVEKASGGDYLITVQDHYNRERECVQRVRIYLPKKASDGKKDDKKKKKTTTSTTSTTTTTTTTTTKVTFTTSTDKGQKTWKLRDEILATCDGGTDVKTHSKHRFGFTNAIHFYGSQRTIFKILDGNGGWICHERSYFKKPPVDKTLTKAKCESKIKGIYSFQGTVRNALFHIFRHSS